MPNPTIVFLTDRGERHQQHALRYAPPELDVIMLRTPPPEVLFPALEKASFLISERNQPVTAEMIAAAPNLRGIVRLGSLLYDIDTAAAERAGVRVAALPIQGVIFCAEHALLLILALCRRLGRSLVAAVVADHGIAPRRTDEDTFAFNWLNYSDLTGIRGKVVGIVGMGEIGVELARRLKGFAPRQILYTKRTPYPAAVDQDLGITFAPLEPCVSEADILVSLLPYSAETDYRNGGGIGAAQIGRMKQESIMVVIGSGSVVDERAVAKALREGRLAGAAFDTYEYEPLTAENPLIALARDTTTNVLLTPHTAAASASADRSGDYAPILAWLREG